MPEDYTGKFDDMILPYQPDGAITLQLGGTDAPLLGGHGGKHITNTPNQSIISSTRAVPARFSPRLVEQGNMMKQALRQQVMDPHTKYMVDFIQLHFPQIQIKHSQMSLEEIYNAVTDGRVIKPEQQAQQERPFQELDYHVKLTEKYQSGVKMTKKEVGDLFMMDLKLLSNCEKKALIEDFKISKEFREAMHFR